MNMTGCRGIENGVQNNTFTICSILFVLLYADDTIILSDNAKNFQDIEYSMHLMNIVKMETENKYK